MTSESDKLNENRRARQKSPKDERSRAGSNYGDARGPARSTPPRDKSLPDGDHAGGGQGRYGGDKAVKRKP